MICGLIPRLNPGFCVRSPGPLSACISPGDFDRPYRSTANLSVTHFKMNLGVAGLTERHQIAELTATALRHWSYVVNLLGWCQLSLFQTHLAQWVLTYVSAADLFPCSSVMLIGIGTAFVLVVTAPCRLLVFLAVLTDTQVRTAGKGTGTLGFRGHWVHLFQKKSPAEVRKALCIFVYCKYNIL